MISASFSNSEQKKGSGAFINFTDRKNLEKAPDPFFPSRLNNTRARRRYPAVFQGYGLAVGKEAAAATGAKIRQSLIAEALSSSMTEWFFVDPKYNGLLAVIDLLDPDPMRAALRAEPGYFLGPDWLIDRSFRGWSTDYATAAVLELRLGGQSASHARPVQTHESLVALSSSVPSRIVPGRRYE